MGTAACLRSAGEPDAGRWRMKRLEDVLNELRTIERTEVMTWIEAEWVRPERDDAGPRFHPVDLARLRLIKDLREDLEIGPEAMPVVLSLVDEMYTLRRRLAALARAVSEAPSDVRTTMRTRCRALLQFVDDEIDRD
jgi:chaperone modulatory protein CbpM